MKKLILLLTALLFCLMSCEQTSSNFDNQTRESTTENETQNNETNDEEELSNPTENNPTDENTENEGNETDENEDNNTTPSETEPTDDNPSDVTDNPTENNENEENQNENPTEPTDENTNDNEGDNNGEVNNENGSEENPTENPNEDDNGENNNIEETNPTDPINNGEDNPTDPNEDEEEPTEPTVELYHNMYPTGDGVMYNDTFIYTSSIKGNEAISFEKQGNIYIANKACRTIGGTSSCEIHLMDIVGLKVQNTPKECNIDNIAVCTNNEFWYGDYVYDPKTIEMKWEIEHCPSDFLFGTKLKYIDTDLNEEEITVCFGIYNQGSQYQEKVKVYIYPENREYEIYLVPKTNTLVIYGKTE